MIQLNKIRCLLYIVYASLIAMQARADLPTNMYVKKLIQADTTMFLACTNQNQCSVLGGGSFKNSDLALKAKQLKLKHNLQNTGIVVAATASMALNPVAIFSFLSIPAGVITFAGSSAYVYLNHKNFESYKKIEMLSSDKNLQLSNRRIIELLDSELNQLRQQINKPEIEDVDIQQQAQNLLRA